MNVRHHITVMLVASASAMLPLLAGAQGTKDPAASTADELPQLPNIVVTAQQIKLTKSFLDTTSITVRDREDLERFEAADIFSAIQDIPGVSVLGSALENGKSFSIRGFSDSEDVSVELDGIPRDFEKYRFGTGIFIDPELLRQIEVWRQPSVRSTPGAIGGAVRAWSRNPQDLTGSEGWYASSKLSLSTNNNGRRVSGIGALQPTEYLGGLIAVSRRRSNDITVGGGEKLENSDTDNTSVLAKLQLQPSDTLSIALSYQGWRDEGLEPFDATAGLIIGDIDSFGTVRRTTDDETYAMNSSYSPNNWLTVNLNMGHTITKVEDFAEEGQAFNARPGIGPTRDNYEFRSSAFRLENHIQQSLGDHSIDLYVGADGLQGEREAKRVTSNSTVNNILYPNGDNLAQPSGEKSFIGAYTLARWAWRPLLLFGGLRRTEYYVSALGSAADQLVAAGQDPSIRFGSSTGEFGGELTIPSGFTIFYNNSTAIRPPLIDEYFTQGGFSRCLPFFLGPTLAPPTLACGDLYVPEEMRSREIGVNVTATLADDRADLSMKLTRFRSKVRNPLETIGPYNGEISQSGIGRRDGVEVEAELAWEPLFTRIGYTQIRGESFKPATDAFDPDGSPIRDRPYFFNVPADRLNVLLGTRLFNETLEVGYRFSRTDSRLVAGGDIANPTIGEQAGYSLHDIYLLWTPTEQLSLRVVGSNIVDEEFDLNNGFGGGSGTAGPGRDFTFVLSINF